MRQASVGFHCPECSSKGKQKVVRPFAARGADTVTRVLIGMNIAVFLADVASGGHLSLDGTVAEGVRVPGLGAWTYNGPAIVELGEWWRIVTSGFVHFGPFHLAMNMYALWILGQQFERLLGPRAFVALYATGLLAGAAMVSLMEPLSSSAGASGAIFGLLGAALVFQRSRGIDIWASGLGGVLVLNLIISVSIRGISFAGHLGGFIGGIVAGWLFFEFAERNRDERLAFVLTALFAIGCVVVAYIGSDNYLDPILGKGPLP